MRKPRRKTKSELRYARRLARVALLSHPRMQVLQRRRVRMRRRLGLLALLLFLLMSVLCATRPPDIPGVEGPDTSQVSDSPPTPVLTKKPEKKGPQRVVPSPGRPRPRLPRADTQRAIWLDAVRLQSGARGPRLARCFEGARSIGALRWSAAIDPKSGQVFDATVEAVEGSVLSPEQHRCVLQVLRDPPYRLPATEVLRPRRVSILLEF